MFLSRFVFRGFVTYVSILFPLFFSVFLVSPQFFLSFCKNYILRGSWYWNLSCKIRNLFYFDRDTKIYVSYKDSPMCPLNIGHYYRLRSFQLTFSLLITALPPGKHWIENIMYILDEFCIKILTLVMVQIDCMYVLCVHFNQRLMGDVWGQWERGLGWFGGECFRE